MSEVPEELWYTEDHEWIRFDGPTATIGITDHAQEALTDIVYVELPAAGDSCQAGEEFATVDSVKSSSPIYAPVTGTVTEVNEELEDTPEQMNEEPYGAGWICRIALDKPDDRSNMMDATAYAALIAG